MDLQVDHYYDVVTSSSMLSQERFENVKYLGEMEFWFRMDRGTSVVSASPIFFDPSVRRLISVPRENIVEATQVEAG